MAKQIKLKVNGELIKVSTYTESHKNYKKKISNINRWKKFTQAERQIITDSLDDQLHQLKTYLPDEIKIDIRKTLFNLLKELDKLLEIEIQENFKNTHKEKI